MKILTDFEKALGQGEPVNFQIKNSDGELKKVSKEEFANWMMEEKEEKNIKTPPKESLVYGASGDIDGTTVFMERKGKDGFVRESYYQPRSEEEKKQIIERNQKRREKEKAEGENLSNSDKKESEKETNQQDFFQNMDNKNSAEKENNLTANQQSSLPSNKNNNQNIYYGVGLISLVLLVVSIAVVWIKKKR